MKSFYHRPQYGGRVSRLRAVVTPYWPTRTRHKVLDDRRLHVIEYLFEALGLGAFMVSACLFAALLEFPQSPVHAAIAHPLARRLVMAIAMGATAVIIIYSPFGKRSGAHLNPAVTLTFFRLGRVRPHDAFFYVAAQLAGGVAGVLVAAAVAPRIVGHPSVRYVVTVPGPSGWMAAGIAELAISFGLMLTVLTLSGHPRTERYTGIAAGVLVAVFIAVEAPYSGMSMNPARSAASSIVANVWSGWWVYLLAPPVAMLAAAEVYIRTFGRERVPCAKLRHPDNVRCIFCGLDPASTKPTRARS